MKVTICGTIHSINAHIFVDSIDKGVDLFQQHVLGAGPQDNESAIEQAKDRAIADEIRRRTGRA